MAIPIDCSLPGPEKGLDDCLVARGKEALIKHVKDCIKASIPSLQEERHLLSEAIKYLSGDVIRDNFLPRVAKAGLTGEKKNAVVYYIGANSRCTNNINGAIHVRNLGASGLGKSRAAEDVLENFITEKYYIERSGLTVASIYRRGEKYFKHKSILLSEFNCSDKESEDINSLFRQLKSRGKAEREVVQKKGKDNFETITLRAEGPVNFISTTTSFSGKDEDKNRDIFISPDESTEQTREINANRTKRNQKYDPKAEAWKKENLKVQETVQDILVKFISTFTEIPYPIKYPEKGTRARRDGGTIDQAVRAICQTNILNRKIKLLDAKSKVDEVKNFVEKFDFATFDPDPVVLIQNLELSLNFRENKGMKDHNNCNHKTHDGGIRNMPNSVLPEGNSLKDNQEYGSSETYEVVIGLDGDNVVIDCPDPFLNYGILEEFVNRRGMEFVLISDERDFSILQEYFGPSIESSYNELEHNLMKNYRLLVEEGERANDYEFTAQRFSKLVEVSDTWALKVLHQLAEKDFAELANPNKKPLKFKIKKNKLAQSYDSEANSKKYELQLNQSGEFPDVSCFDLEYCRITRQFFIKPKNEIKTTDEKSEVPIEEPSTFKNNSASSGGGTATEQQLDIDPVLADIEKRRQRWK